MKMLKILGNNLPYNGINMNNINQNIPQSNNQNVYNKNIPLNGNQSVSKA